ncbi:Oidioi.mRNA.OKI2018_I69.chr2.g7841.t1.cds [Oikopleura dioica]|uniref:Oidioi.mRNA.OKI2018_I69.chr2.g7841.t1.cds n=1 Tax=Oikopleura dioica TaxID=34765 RepID=A0ABN7T7G8_OIKDI|nr:Oidioi.mRNA.OKI2018_I69.chr2.g7841.t1.cds [Oikopleura dioica]
MNGTENSSPRSYQTNSSTNSSPECQNQQIPIYSVWEIVGIVSASTLTSLLTVGANTLVIIAFITNKQLRTINNYLIINLAVADFIVGLVSMNFYTAYIVMQGWSFGPHVCDAWLTLDYVASNTSGTVPTLIFSIEKGKYKLNFAPSDEFADHLHRPLPVGHVSS